jgi:hypothetical protein
VRLDNGEISCPDLDAGEGFGWGPEWEERYGIAAGIPNGVAMEKLAEKGAVERGDFRSVGGIFRG